MNSHHYHCLSCSRKESFYPRDSFYSFLEFKLTSVMTPTKHSEEVPIATECLDSSAKMDSKSAKADNLMVADMLAKMVRPCLWYCLCSFDVPVIVCQWICPFFSGNFMVSDIYAMLLSCCSELYRKKIFENLAIRSWIE